jgi:hypothetical protein
MPKNPPHTIINLTVAIVAVTNDEPRVLLVEADNAGTSSAQMSLPNGPFDPEMHESLESGLRSLVEAQTGLDLYYVEQLYSFGNRHRDLREIEGGPRVVSVAYIALTHEDAVERPNATWHDWYDFLPWEDWRMGQPAIIGEHIEPALSRWVRDSQKSGSRQQREERVNVTFGQTGGSEMDSVLCPERYELLYEAGLVAEASRDYRAANPAVDQELTQQPPFEMGMPLASDYRRILATALGRLRGKLAYRPVVFELLPGEFTLLQLQRVAEALSGAELHKQNFRRLVINADLVESVGRNQAHSRGRPAELFRFRREVLGEKLTVGLSRPMLRGSGAGHSG